MDLLKLNETVKEALAVFIAAVRLGFDPESEVGVAKGPNGEVLTLIKRGDGPAFVVGLGFPAGDTTWEYFLESWKENSQAILAGEIELRDLDVLFESTQFRDKLSEFVDGLIENDLLTLADIRSLEHARQRQQVN